MVTLSDGRPQPRPGQAEWQKAGELTRDVRSTHEPSGEPDGSRNPLRRRRSASAGAQMPSAGAPQLPWSDAVVTYVTYCDTRAWHARFGADPGSARCRGT